MSQELAAPLPDPNSSTSRVEVGVPLPGTMPGHNTLPPGEWLDLTHCVARWKRSYTQRVHLPHRIPGDKDLPVLSKTMELPLDAPHLYLPNEVPAVASHEIARIEGAMPPETTGLDYVNVRLVTPKTVV